MASCDTVNVVCLLIQLHLSQTQFPFIPWKCNLLTTHTEWTCRVSSGLPVGCQVVIVHSHSVGVKWLLYIILTRGRGRFPCSSSRTSFIAMGVSVLTKPQGPQGPLVPQGHRWGDNVFRWWMSQTLTVLTLNSSLVWHETSIYGWSLTACLQL